MIDAQTQLCCIIGNPVNHSLSPQMHNAAYKTLGLNYAYLAFSPANLKNALSGLLAVGVKGVSVTTPFKIEILKYVEQKDPSVQAIGAANTLVNRKGKWCAYNTDWKGVVHALKDATGLKKKRAVIFGSGGAAAAIAYGLKREGSHVFIVGRNYVRGKQLVKDLSLKGNYRHYSDIPDHTNILINATPLGMQPFESESPIDKSVIRKSHVVFDCVYTPKVTKLLKGASERGATVVYGYKMLLYQGIEQFKLFTNHDAPVEVMENVLLQELGNRN